MAIDDLFQNGTDKVLDDRVARPLPSPIPQRSFGANLWGLTSAAPKGGAAGVAESGGFFADILGAYGEVQAGYGAQLDPSLALSTKTAEATRAAGAGARARLDSGEAFSTEIGNSLRATARSMAPDPQAAGTAEQLLFGLGRFATKAVGYTLAGGPIPGAVMLGADEGMTEADRLKAQGVDFETRTKVGAVAGAVAGVSVALPVAGKTLAQTAGLVAVGGPGGFIAQQAATKAILENAKYDKLADQYDPFDPVGLAVSTLVPAGFGAFALRGSKARAPALVDPAAARELGIMGANERLALRYDDPRLDAYAVTAAQREGIPPEALLAIKNAGERSGPRAVSPKGAKGVMQFMDDIWTAYGKGDARDPVASIDAGARFMKDLIKQYDGDVRAALAHYNGGGKAGQAVREGRMPAAKETRDYLARTEQFMAERSGTEAGRAAASDPDMVAAARVQQVRDTVESWNLRDPADAAAAEQHLNAVLRAADQLGAGERVDIGSTVPLDTLGQARLLDNLVGRLEQSRAELLPEAGNLVDPGVVAPLRAEISRLEQSRPAATDEALRTLAKEIQAAQSVSYKAALSAAKKDIGTRLDGIDAQIGRLRQQLDAHRAAAETQKQIAHLDSQIARIKSERAEIASPTPRPAALAVKQAMADMGGSKPGKPATIREATATKAPESATEPAAAAPAAPAGKQSANPIAASLEAQSAEIAKLSPDMMVQLEGMDAPMRLADALEAVKAEAARDVQDAPLLQVAAECFLRSA
jgi:soluble lytic murein transglycosylase-like protein